MARKKSKNERIGIFAIIILIVLAIIGLYFSSHPAAVATQNSRYAPVPAEAPTPLSNNNS